MSIPSARRHSVRASGSNLFGIQAWVALPSRHEEVAADFVHYSAPEIPRICARGVEFTLIAGTSDGLISPVKTFSDMVLCRDRAYQRRAIPGQTGSSRACGLCRRRRGRNCRPAPAHSERAELILLEPGVEIVRQGAGFLRRTTYAAGRRAAFLNLATYTGISSPPPSSASSRQRSIGVKVASRLVPGENEFMPLPEH